MAGQRKVVSRTSKAMADQITTAARQRLRTKVGVLAKTEMRQLEMAIHIQLGLRL
jgi:mRNA-degrading endonuclease toxin of MazEF toxin-antitoxin module